MLSPDIAPSGDPQILQKQRTPSSDDWYLPTLPSPVCQEKEPGFTSANVPKAEPCALRHIEQWQLPVWPRGWSIE
jgi:hypothetical protein